MPDGQSKMRSNNKNLLRIISIAFSRLAIDRSSKETFVQRQLKNLLGFAIVNETVVVKNFITLGT